MDSKCKNCKSSAWCLSTVWPVEKEFYSSDKVELVTQVARCAKCGAFWRLVIWPDVGGTVGTRFDAWDVRPCEREEEFGHVEHCSHCVGYPEKVILPMREGGELVINIRHG